MIPTGFPSLGLRDPGFLQSSGFTPDPADPDLFGWWSADKYVTEVSNVISVWGDRTNNTVNKAALTGTRNLIPVGALKMRLSNNDGSGNLLFASQDMTQAIWTTFLFTKNSATTGTFTGQGGVINAISSLLRAGVSYTLKATMRAVSGNVNLEWVTYNSPSGNYTAVTVTGALADYTRVFTGAGGVYLGIRDNNAAGHGQIEVTKWQLCETGWGATGYVDTGTATNAYYIPTLAGKQVIWTHGNSGYCWPRNESFTDVADITKLTAYFAIYWPHTTIGLGPFLTNRNTHSSWSWYADLNPTDQSAYVNTAPFARLDTGSAVPAYGFSIFTAVYNGANSSVRVNKNAAVTGALGVIPANEHHGLELGNTLSGNCSTCGFYEVLVRRVADNTATQDLYIDYLASRVGIVV
jgi:hypothetical protein